MKLSDLRRTTGSAAVGAIRILLGILFLMTGIMKLAVPRLGEAFAGQLASAQIPFRSFNEWFVPIMEILTGLMLLLGIHTRVAALATVPMMLVATYVHLFVHDPRLFPLQPGPPVIPLAVLALSAAVIWKGGGKWSIDLAKEAKS